MKEPNGVAFGEVCAFDLPPGSVLQCVEMLAVEAHHLHAVVASLENRVSTVTCGLKHVLNMMSSGESRGLDKADEFRASPRRDDCFWDFFSCESSILQKWNDRVQGKTLLDEITKVSQMCDSEVETSDDISELNFYESLDSSRWDTGEVGEIGGSFNDWHQQLVVKSTEDSGGISHSFTDAERSDDMPSGEVGSNLSDLHRQLVVKSTEGSGGTGSVLQLLEPQKYKIQKGLDSLIWKAARLVAT